MEERNNCFVSAALVVLSVVGICYTKTISTNAAKYPMFVLWLIVILGLGLFLKSFIAIRRQEGGLKQEEKQPVLTKREWGVIGIAIAYAVLLSLVGFIIASLLVFVGLAIYIGYRKWVVLGIVSVCSVAMIYYVFFEYLNLPYISGSLFG